MALLKRCLGKMDLPWVTPKQPLGKQAGREKSIEGALLCTGAAREPAALALSGPNRTGVGLGKGAVCLPVLPALCARMAFCSWAFLGGFAAGYIQGEEEGLGFTPVSPGCLLPAGGAVAALGFPRIWGDRSAHCQIQVGTDRKCRGQTGHFRL